MQQTKTGERLDSEPAHLRGQVPALPNAWFGLVFAAAITFGELSQTAVPNIGVASFNFLVLGCSSAYWLFCIFRLHRVLGALDPDYPISPQAAVGFHFVPVYSLYWIFAWPGKLSDLINSRGNRGMAGGSLLGLIIFGCIAIGQASWGLGLAAIFLTTAYMVSKVEFELRYSRVEPPPTGEPSLERLIGGVLLGNAFNYLVANSFFILLLLLFVNGFNQFLISVTMVLLFVSSGAVGGFFAGNIARRSGPIVGAAASIASFGSILVGLDLSRHEQLFPAGQDLIIFSALAGLGLAAAIFMSIVGRRQHLAGHYPHLIYWATRPRPTAKKGGVIISRGVGTSGLAEPDRDPDLRRSLLAIFSGNLAGALILMFYRYPAAFIDLVWAGESFVIGKTADSFVIMTGAFVAAYISMLIAKRNHVIIGLGSNFIIFFFIVALSTDALISDRSFAGFIAVFFFAPLVAGAGILGAMLAGGGDASRADRP